MIQQGGLCQTPSCLRPNSHSQTGPITPNKRKLLVPGMRQGASLLRDWPDFVKRVFFAAFLSQMSRKRLVFENQEYFGTRVSPKPKHPRPGCPWALLTWRGSHRRCRRRSPSVPKKPSRFEKCLFRKPPRNSGFGARLGPVGSL